MEYGLKLERPEKIQRFGDTPRGINITNGKVVYIKINAHGRYPNHVHKDEIFYCFENDSYDAGRARNAALRRAVDPETSFRVLVENNTQSYDWGYGYVASDTDVHLHHGTSFRRFLIKKSRGPDPISETGDPEAKRPRVCNSFSIAAKFEDVWYDSKLEAKHALFMRILGLEFEREPIVRNNIRLTSGEVVTYTIDFWVASLGFYLEVKGKQPDEDGIEWQKCIDLCRHTERDVVMFYDDVFTTDAVPRRIHAVRFHVFPNLKTVVAMKDCVWAVVDGQLQVAPEAELVGSQTQHSRLIEACNKFATDIVRGVFTYDS
jgi:hypothetical protein